ncbi:MAG: STAS domain-containing protein [Deltaproteobacteria bacterium]|nr:STAS domain-containing protein [Deltaproteobacteria bacterium]
MANKKENNSVLAPVNVIWEGILLIPISGTIDSKRAQEIMETILKKIIETKSKSVIMDVLGVVTVDSAVANHLIKITKATKLLGARCIVSGIVPEIAQIIVALGVDLGEVDTRADIADALELAFEVAGLEVVKRK